MKMVFVIILALILASGCMAEDQPKEKVDTGKPINTDALPVANEPSVTVIGEYPLGDFGKLKNVTLLTKELVMGNDSYSYYQAIYYWNGEAYRTGALNRIYPDNEDILPLSPPHAPGNAYGKAFEWVKNNTPEDAVFLSWWDYGDFIRVFAQREALISDPCSKSQCLKTLSDDEKDIFRYEDDEKFNDVLKFFTSDEDEAYKIAKKYGVDYVFITYEDFQKSSAIEYLAGKKGLMRVFTVDATGDRDKDLEKIIEGINEHRVSAYFIKKQNGKYYVWYLVPEDVQKIRERLLLNLLPFNLLPGNFNVWEMLNNFELVYKDEGDYVYIFKVT